MAAIEAGKRVTESKGDPLHSTPERRGKGRAKLAQKVRVRPSEPQGQEFDEVVETLNVCRTGICFASDRDAYYRDMRLFVTYPYATGPSAINQEYIGRVVRIDRLPAALETISSTLKNC